MWVPPIDSLMRLGVSPTATTPTGFYSQKFWGFNFPCWNSGLRGLSHSLVVPPRLSTHKCPPWSTSHCLSVHLLCLPPLFLPVWMNVSSLTPRLSDFHNVVFSSSSGCFCFFNWLVSFFWLGEEGKLLYLLLHLGQKLWCSLYCLSFQLPPYRKQDLILKGKKFLIKPHSICITSWSNMRSYSSWLYAS